MQKILEIKNKIRALNEKIDVKELGVEKEILANTLFYRLTIIRLGEEDNNAWWDSLILSQVGRRNLERFFPNTFLNQRYDIARKVVYEREKRIIQDKDFISLFYYGYDFENRIFKEYIHLLSGLNEWSELFQLVEDIKDVKVANKWMREMYNIETDHVNKDEEVINIGIMQNEFYKTKETFDHFIKGILSVYENSNLGVVYTPYYRKGMAI